MTDKEALAWLRKAKAELMQTTRGYTPTGVHWRRGFEYLDKVAAHLAPPEVPLVEPKQGWASLHKSLWQIYSIGRGMGMADLGTYNPASKLPSGAPSDHAVKPAYAFDLGIDPDLGYAHPAGRKFFDLCKTRPEVEYVILGNKIWSRSGGLREYTGGGHLNHVHVSGNR